MGGGDIKQHGLDAHLWRSTHRMGCTGPPLYHSSRRLSTLAHRCAGPLYLFSKLQSSFRNKEPLRPICYSRRTQLQQCVTHCTLTLSWLAFFSLEPALWPLENFPNCSLLCISFFLCPLFPFCDDCPFLVLFYCFVLLISMVTASFPGIMKAWGLRSVNSDGFFINR